jgi:nitroreductase
MMKISIGGFLYLVLARSSIRQYATRLIDNSKDREDFRKEVHNSIQLAAEGTPSVCNRQGVKVVAVRDVEKMEQTIAMQGGGRGHDNPEHRIMIATNLQIYREERERNQACVDGGLFAMTHMCAVQSKGLTTCSLDFAASMQMRKLLEVDDPHAIVMFMAVRQYREDIDLLSHREEPPMTHSRSLKKYDESPMKEIGQNSNLLEVVYVQDKRGEHPSGSASKT